MIFTYDRFNQPDIKYLYLAKPDKTYYGTLQFNNGIVGLLFNGLSELSFTSYQYYNDAPNAYYDNINLLNLIEVEDIGWFQISSVSINGSGKNAYKEITALSLENELTTKTLNSFGSMGTETDDTGGLDRYCLYSPTDTQHSILHTVIDKAPAWKIGYIDPDITTEYRSFSQDSIDAYSFLTGDVSDAFKCVFQFDTFERSISAYKLTNIGNLTGIYLSYQNLIQTLKIDSNASDIKTVMSVSGGDETGSTLGIIEVNPTGSNYISNFSYYYPIMSEELKTQMKLYDEKYKDNVEMFNKTITNIQTMYKELTEIENHLTGSGTEDHSTNWDNYGLEQLKTEQKYYEARMSEVMDGSDETKRKKYYEIINGDDGVLKAIEKRQSEYDAKKLEIEIEESNLDQYKLNIKDFLGEDLYKELSNYAHYTDFVDEAYVVTESMTESEVYQMKLDLMEKAREELEKVCKPSYTMTVDTINFSRIPEFRDFADQLKLGDFITVEFDNDLTIESRLLKVQFGLNNSDSFELTFCSKKKLDSGWAEFAEIQQQASQSSLAVTINGNGWNNATKQSVTMNHYMNHALDASKQMLMNNKNETFVIDETGTKWRKYLSNGTYSNNQMWGTGNGLYLTQNNWKDVSVAIGEINLGDGTIQYGVAAPLLIGTTVLGEKFKIANSNNTMTLDNNGIIATNGVNQIRIDPNLKRILEITKEGASIFFVDTDGNINMSGKITGSNISSTAIVGGSININGKFMVNSEGDVTLPSTATISWNEVSDQPTNLLGAVTTISKDAISTATIRANQIDTDGLTVQSLSAHGMMDGVDYKVDRDMTLDIHGGRLVCYTGTNYDNARYITSIIDSGMYTEYIHTNNISPRTGGTLEIAGYAKLSDIPTIPKVPTNTSDLKADTSSGSITFNGASACGFQYASGKFSSIESRLSALESKIK